VAVDFFGGVRAQQLVLDVEGVLQLQMCPVIERIAEAVWDGLRPFLELFVVTRLAGDVFLGDAVGPHRAPFVVVAGQPGLCQVVEAGVGGDFLGGQVTVIIVDRHLRRVLVVESPCRFGLQQEIFAQKLLCHLFCSLSVAALLAPRGQGA